MSRLFLKRNSADNWHEVVTDSKEEVRFTFTFDNLTNPTNYVSERSVSAKLPRCPDNDIYFGHVCMLDSMVIAGGYDPSVKMKYLAMDRAGMVVSEGEAVINEVTRDHYSLSLVGTQSVIFSKALNAGYSTEKAAADPEYYLMADPLQLSKSGTTFTPATNKLNRHTVRASWRIDNPLFDLSTIKSTASLVGAYGVSTTETLAWIASLIGFAPTLQGKYPAFNNDKWLECAIIDGTLASSPDIIPVLSTRTYLNGEPADSYKVEGTIYEQQLGEYRSYYQQPYIYVSALWQLMAEEFKAITGYDLSLDARWFNPSNPELGRMVYMLQQKTIDEPLIDEITLLSDTSTVNLPVDTVTESFFYPVVVNGISSIGATLTSSAVHVNAGEKATFKYTLSAILDILPHTDGTGFILFSNAAPLEIVVTVGNVQRRYIVINTTEQLDKDYFVDKALWDGIQTGIIADCMRDARLIMTSDYNPIVHDTQTTVTVCNFSDEITVLAAADSNLTLSVSFSFYGSSDYSPFARTAALENITSGWYDCPIAPQLAFSLTGVSVRRYKNDRSGRPLTMEGLFGDITPFNVLLQYAKAHNLVWAVDTNNQVVTVRRSSDAFADYMNEHPLDITENIDRNVSIRPLSWEDKSVLFNMGDMGTDYVEGYEERAGIPYGSKRIITVGNVAKGENVLFEGGNVIKASAVASLTAAPVVAIQSLITDTIIEGRKAPINVKGEESANVSGNFYYRHNNLTISQDPFMKFWASDYIITDDSTEEISYSTYCWQGKNGRNGLLLSIIPYINTVSDSGQSVLFAPVREAYTLTPDVATKYLYEKAWQNYTEEVYNVQNKTIETLIHLPRNIFDRVRHNPLVIIDHILYLMTEIKSWGEHNTLCRCKLRQITDINKLTT